jgi:preprotein translocase subunit SecE
MGKSKAATHFWQGMWTLGIYKRNQGRLVRQGTAIALGLMVFLGAYTLYQSQLADLSQTWLKLGIPVTICTLGAWVVFRLVNYPPFADFLISVEAELDKVNWPTKQELYRSTLVVIATMFVLGMILFLYDVFWQWIFRAIGYLKM